MLKLLILITFFYHSTAQIAVYTTCTSPKTVSLTFDDGPSTLWTSQVLSLLRHNNIKATFFVIGRNLQNQNQKSLLEQTVADGHLVGSHSYTHTDVDLLTNDELLKELTDTENAISQVVGFKPIYFRPPYGSIPSDKGEFIRSLGYKIINWNVSTRDSQSNTTVQIAYDYLISGLRATNRGIVLMHDVQKVCYEALPLILEYLRAQSYNIVRLDECI